MSNIIKDLLTEYGLGIDNEIVYNSLVSFLAVIFMLGIILMISKLVSPSASRTRAVLTTAVIVVSAILIVFNAVVSIGGNVIIREEVVEVGEGYFLNGEQISLTETPTESEWADIQSRLDALELEGNAEYCKIRRNVNFDLYILQINQIIYSNGRTYTPILIDASQLVSVCFDDEMNPYCYIIAVSNYIAYVPIENVDISVIDGYFYLSQ